MKTTSTTVLPNRHSVWSGQLFKQASENTTGTQETTSNLYDIVCLEAVGSANPHQSVSPSVSRWFNDDDDGFSVSVKDTVLRVVRLNRNFRRDLFDTGSALFTDSEVLTSALADMSALFLVNSDQRPRDFEHISHHPIVQKFAIGTSGERLPSEVVAIAERIIDAALEFTSSPEFSVDEDGALSIDLRLSNGLRMLAELPIDGTLDIGTYDDRDPNRRAREIEYLPSATAEDLIRLLCN